MARDYKVRNSRSRNAETGGWRWLLALILIILFIALIVFLKQQSIKLAASEQQNNTMTTSTATLSPKKTIKATPPPPPSPPQPHFDFYTMLPQGQTATPLPASPSQPVIHNSQPAPIMPPVVSPVVTTEKPIAPATAVKPSLTPKPSTSENNKNSVAKEIENLLQTELGDTTHTANKTAVKSKTYLVQLGIFKTFEAADALKAQITLQGFEVKLKPVKKGNLTLYRLFLGPYSSLTEAKQQEQTLLRNQIKSRIVKTS